MSGEWITDADLELLQGPLDPPGKYEKVAEAMLRRQATKAVKVVVDIAMNSDNDKLRLDAAKYVLDRVLGRPDAKSALEPTEKAGWQEIIESTLVEPSHADRKAGQAIERRRYDD